jgi:hypothetical protein
VTPAVTETVKPVTPAVTETVKPVTPVVTERPVTPAVTETVKPVTPAVTERPVTPVVTEGVVSQAAASPTVRPVTSAVTERTVNQHCGVVSAINSATTTVATPSGPNTTHKPRRLESNVPKYKGDTNLSVYLAQFEVIAELADWPREIWGRQLLAALDGRALQILAVETWSAARTYEEVTAKLKANFGQEISSAVYLHELGLLQRRDQETLYNLCMRVKDIAAKALPGLDGRQRSQFCMQHFINALGNPQQQSAIWAARVTTLEDALEVAVACENGARMTRSDSTRGEKRANPQIRQLTADWEEESYETSDDYTRKALGEITTKLCGLETTVRQLKLGESKSNGNGNQKQSAGKGTTGAAQTTSSTTTAPKDKVPYCHNCKTTGHWLRECTVARHRRLLQLRPRGPHGQGLPLSTSRCGNLSTFTSTVKFRGGPRSRRAGSRPGPSLSPKKDMTPPPRAAGKGGVEVNCKPSTETSTIVADVWGDTASSKQERRVMVTQRNTNS